MRLNDNQNLIDIAIQILLTSIDLVSLVVDYDSVVQKQDDFQTDIINKLKLCLKDSVKLNSELG